MIDELEKEFRSIGDDFISSIFMILEGGDIIE